MGLLFCNRKSPIVCSTEDARLHKLISSAGRFHRWPMTVHGDVLSIRARQRSRILYRVCDTHESEWYSWRPKSSSRPLTLGQIISLIDGARGQLSEDGGLVANWKRRHLDGEDPDEMAGEFEITSVFYSQLHDYYVARFERWLSSLVYS